MKHFKFEAQDIVDDGRTNIKLIVNIREWIEKNPDLPNIPDEMIVLFLLSCNNELEDTRKTIEAYFQHKENAPEIFDDRDIDLPDVKKALDTVYLSTFPARTKENYAIHYFKLKDTNYANLDLVPCMKLAYMLLDVTQEKNPPSGLVVLMDMEGVGLMHITRVKLGAIRKFFQFLQEAMPIQLKAIHVLNTVSFFDKFLAIVQAFIKNELMQLIKTHLPGMDMEEFFKDFLPKECMPKNYGGLLPSVEELYEITIQQFRQRKPFFDYEEEIRKMQMINK